MNLSRYIYMFSSFDAGIASSRVALIALSLTSTTVDVRRGTIVISKTTALTSRDSLETAQGWNAGDGWVPIRTATRDPATVTEKFLEKWLDGFWANAPGGL